MSDASIVSVRELIDIAFGDVKGNRVNFKLIQTVLYLLARQLRVLERRVIVELGTTLKPASSSLLVTEIKIQANVSKSGKGRDKSTPVLYMTKSEMSRKLRSGTTSGSVFDIQNPNTKLKKSSTGVQYKKREVADVETGDDVIELAIATAQRKSVPGVELTKKESISMIIDSDQRRSSGKNITFRKSLEKKVTEEEKEIIGTKKRKPPTKQYGEESTSVTRFRELKRDQDIAEKNVRGRGSTKRVERIDSRIHPSKEKTQFEYWCLLEQIEEQREKVLRVIKQRSDSRDAGIKTPPSMTALPQSEVQIERLLVVQRMSQDDVGKEKKDVRKLSFATKDQFYELMGKVTQLKSKLDASVSTGDPEAVRIMEELRKGTTLSNAMAALQLSTRLEAAEHTLDQLNSLIQEMLRKRADEESKITHAAIKDGSVLKRHSQVTNNEFLEQLGVAGKWITYEDLDAAVQDVYNEFSKYVQTATSRTNKNAAVALNMVNEMGAKIEAAYSLGEELHELESSVAGYADQINSFDTEISSQMTYYQEQLTQMQHELETGLENMAEALANQGGEDEAMQELNGYFSKLQEDIEASRGMQKKLNEVQKRMALDLQQLRKEIEILRDVKCDRDEVADALRDKAGISDLNGLVSKEQFDAVRGDIERNINTAYDKFNNQELVWQKAIDELIRSINEKVDIRQVDSVCNDIDGNIAKLERRINAMLEILGEPRTSTLTRRIHRENPCLSCSTAITTDLDEEDKKLPARPPTVGAEDPPRGEGDGERPCIPNLPIPHPRDPRALICSRYCGGVHTVKPTGAYLSSALNAQSIPKKAVEEKKELKKFPCVPCNPRKQKQRGLIVIKDIESTANSIISVTHDERFNVKQESEDNKQ